MTVGYVLSDLDQISRKDAYSNDVVYVTNNEIGFDFLRDNMILKKEHQAMRDPYFAVVDEVDSILIDEARTPLIISGVAEDNSSLYRELRKIIPSLKEELLDPETGEVEKKGDYLIDLASNSIEFSNQGHEKIEKNLKESGIIATTDTLYLSLIHI